MSERERVKLQVGGVRHAADSEISPTIGARSVRPSTGDVRSDCVGAVPCLVGRDLHIFRSHRDKQRVEIAPPLPHPARLVVRQPIAVSNQSIAQIVGPFMGNHFIVDCPVAIDGQIAT